MRRMRGLYVRLSREAPFDLAHQLNPVEVGGSLALAGTGATGAGSLHPRLAPATGAGRPARARRWARSAWCARPSSGVRPRCCCPRRPQRPSSTGRRAALRVHELPPGIDERAWRPGGDPGAGQDVLFLANLEVRKGIHVLLDAFEALTRLPQARLRVAGQGPEIEQVRAASQTPALAGWSCSATSIATA